LITETGAAESLRSRIKLEKLIATIFTHFVNLNPGEIDQSIHFALQAIGNFAEAERCYILILAKNDTSFEAVYEWHTPNNTQPEARNLEQVAPTSFPWVFRQLHQHQTINIANLDILPSEAIKEREYFISRNTHSFTMVPMIYSGRLVGILGFEFVEDHQLWPEDILPLLKIVGEMFVNAFERTKAEEALRAGEERFRQVITSISDHVYFWKVNQAGEHINLYLSPNVEELTGYPYSQFENDWAFWSRNVIHPEDRDTAAKQAAKLESGQNSKTEYRLVMADGTIIWVRDSGRTERSRGEIYVYGVVADINDRKQAEEALAAERSMLAQRVQERTSELQMANAELARAARMKDEFLAAMSHELRTPLNAVLGMSEALIENVYGELNDKQTNALKRIEESGRHLLTLINDILDLSRINAGKLELHPWPIDADTVCQVSIHYVEKDAAHKRIKINTNIQSGIRLYADERRLKQVLINLLSNAVKFTPKGGEIGLEVERVPEADAVRFVVWDTGIGIDEADMKQLFKPFVQLDSRLSRQYEGTGLGLTLVYKMIEMHQGSVSVESKLNEGSRFSVMLPCSEAGNSEVFDEETNEPSVDNTVDIAHIKRRRNARILLVEDNEANITATSNYLEAQNFNVDVARNGTQALEQVREKQPALIVMDVQMPVMDGMEATQHIRANAAWQDIPIIAVTALAMPGDRERCLAAGANEYLSKPVSLRQLVRVIDRLLTG
jgi:PAS domain S-box-containing protein